jgi:hypothetical protein
MDPSDIAPMVMGLTFMVVGGAVLILRPIAKRLGDYLETLAAARRAQVQTPQDRRLVETLERVEERLRLLEDRQDFTDAMLARGSDRARLPQTERTHGPQGG